MKKAAAFLLIIVLIMCFSASAADYGKSNVLVLDIIRNSVEQKTPGPEPKAKSPDAIQSVINKNEAEKSSKVKTFVSSCPKSIFYPFAIHLVSLKSKPETTKEMNNLKNQLSGLFITEIDLASGHWYRLDYGLFKSFREAQSKLDEIKKIPAIDKNSFVGPSVGLTIELGLYDSKQTAQKELSSLSQKGISSYIIEESQSCFRLVSGAYPDMTSAQTALKAFSNAGLSPGLVKR